jgi:hypothetical protein
VLGDSLGLRATLTATGSAVILLAVAAFFGSRLRHVPDLSRNRTVQERIDLALPQPS